MKSNKNKNKNKKKSKNNNKIPINKSNGADKNNAAFNKNNDGFQNKNPIRPETSKPKCKFISGSEDEAEAEEYEILEETEVNKDDIRLLESNDGEEEKQLKIHKDTVNKSNNLNNNSTPSPSLSDNSDNSSINSEDKNEEKTYVKHFPDFKSKGEIYSMSLCKDNRTLIIGNGNDETIFYDTVKKEIIKECAYNKESVGFITFSKDYRYLLTASIDGQINLFNSQNFTLISELKSPKQEEIFWVEWNPKGPMFAYGCKEGNSYIYIVDNTSDFVTVFGRREAQCGKFSLDGRRLIVCYDDGCLRVYDVRVGRVIRDIRGKIGPIFSMAINLNVPDNSSNLVVVGSTHNEIQFINYETCEILFYQHYINNDDDDYLLNYNFDNLNDTYDEEYCIDSIEFCFNNKICCFSDRHSHFKIMDLILLEVKADFKLEAENINKIYSLRKLNHLALAAGTNGNVYVFDILGKGKILSKIKMHNDTVNDIVIDSEERFFISGSWDCTVNFHEIEEQK